MGWACQAMNTALEVLLEVSESLELDEEAIGMETEKMESSAVPAYRAAVLMYRANGNRTMLEKQIRRCVEKVQKMRTELLEDEGLGKHISMQQVWKNFRGVVVSIVTSTYWDSFLFLVIVSNMVVIALTRPNVGPETDTTFDEYDETMEAIDHCYTAFYTVEAARPTLSPCLRPPPLCHP